MKEKVKKDALLTEKNMKFVLRKMKRDSKTLIMLIKHMREIDKFLKESKTWMKGTEARIKLLIELGNQDGQIFKALINKIKKEKK